MKHLGDITQIRGGSVPAVDVIIGGSPCQDLSVAGKRAGLSGERSGLYMEQIRIIKEMRASVRTNGHIRGRSPRYMVWENVPGAFSSNGCEDFRVVLEEAARVVEPECVAPRPPKDKWSNAGCIMGDGWSLAWRVHDAQFWGVPQRRRRIALVADFEGGSAPEILFERKGLRGDIAESRTAREGATGDAESGVGTAVCIQGNCIDRADTAGCNGRGWRDDDVSFTLNTIDRPAVYDARGNGDGVVCPTITGDHENSITDYTAVLVGPAVRRLTPLECERLQGFPDGWTDIGEWIDTKGKRHQTTDSARYKALGNSIALPYWRYLLKRISAQFEYVPTMASLFDGIGGFPYLWESINGKGTCLWASEIEEFPIAVTKCRIGE